MSKYNVHVRDKYEYASSVDNDIYTPINEEVEADAVTVKDGALLFLTDKKIVKGYNRDNWLDFNKIF